MAWEWSIGVELLTGLLDGLPADVLARQVAREKPRLGPFHSPPVTQNLQEPGRKHHVAILLALALLDANHHPRAVDVAGGEANRLGDAQAGCVARGEDGAVLGAADAVEKLQHLFRLKTTGSVCGFFGAGMMSSNFQSFLSETRYTKRIAATAMRMDAGASFFSLVR